MVERVLLLGTGERWFGLFSFGLIANGGCKNHSSIELMISDNYKDNGAFLWRAGDGNYESPGNNNENNYNQSLELSKKLNEECFVSKNPFYFSMSLDTSKIYKEIDGINCYKYSIFINNEKIGDFNYNKNSWDYFCENDLPIANEFFVGRVIDFDDIRTYMEVFSLRIYNRALSDTEIQQSYSDSVAAHDKLVADSEN